MSTLWIFGKSGSYSAPEVGTLTSPGLTGRVLDFLPIGKRLVMLIFKLENTALAVLRVYAVKEESKYSTFLLVEADTQQAAKADSFILKGNFNAHVGNDAETWRCVIGRNGLLTVNPNEESLLDFLRAHGMAFMNTFF